MTAVGGLCGFGMKWGRTKVSHSTVWCVCASLCVRFHYNDRSSISNRACTWVTFDFCLMSSVCVCTLPVCVYAHLKQSHENISIFIQTSSAFILPLNLSSIFIFSKTVRYDDEKWWNSSSCVIWLICSLDRFIWLRTTPGTDHICLFKIT